MKKRWISLLLATVTLCLVAAIACNKTDTYQKIVLNEVAHSIFYAPMYVAIESGYFEEEGLEVTLVNGAGADNVMTAVLSGDADVGFMGSEASVYVYAEGAKDYVVNFAQLTQRAGNFLVAREADADFTWDKVKGKTVIGGRAGGCLGLMYTNERLPFPKNKARTSS